jgi:hypothetical protein
MAYFVLFILGCAFAAWLVAGLRKTGMHWERFTRAFVLGPFAIIEALLDPPNHQTTIRAVDQKSGGGDDDESSKASQVKSPSNSVQVPAAHVSKRESQTDRRGRTRWRYSSNVPALVDPQTPERRVNRIREFLSIVCVKRCGAAAAVYLAVTLGIHNSRLEDYRFWLLLNRVGSPVVCVTFTGKRYHRPEHRVAYLRRPLFDAVREGYTPCRTCHPPLLRLSDEDRRRQEPSYIGFGFTLIGLSIGWFVFRYRTRSDPKY